MKSKKLLILFSLLVSFFLFNNSVNAETFLNKYDNEFYFVNTFDMTDDEYLKIVNNLDSNIYYSHPYYTVDDYIYARNLLKEAFGNTSAKYILFDYCGHLYYVIINSNFHSSLSVYNKDNSFYIYFGVRSTDYVYMYKYDTSSKTFSKYSQDKFFGIKLGVYDATNTYYDYIGFYETNYHSDYTKYETSISPIYQFSGDINYDNTTYSINDYLPIDVYYGLNAEDYYKPSLSLKATFNSGTNAGSMQRLSVEFNESDKNIEDGKIFFKIQTGSNSLSLDEIPVLREYKVYGRDEKENWKEIELEKDLSDGDNIIYSITDFKTEENHLEGTSAEDTYTFTLNIPKTICIYENLKIEFIFDNTSNFYAYMFDSLNNSTYFDNSIYFEGYTYYKFDKNYRYAFISYNENASERVYFLKSSYETVHLRGYEYNYLNNKVSSSAFYPYVYDLDDDYYYYDFDIDHEDGKIMVLTRYKNEEDAFFYAPSNYTVSFFNISDGVDTIISTPNGNVYPTIDSIKDDNIYNDETSHWYDILVKPFVDYIDRNLPIVGQIGTIISSLTFKENEQIPDLTFKLSFLGDNKRYTLIDIDTYSQVRDIVFSFEQIALCLYVIPKIIRNLRQFFGGGD